MKLADRMTRADTLNDGRLLRVTRGARLLAIALDAAAENTGCLRDDVAEIRRTVGWFVCDDGGELPSVEQLEAWLRELVITGWLIEYESAGTLGLYAKGFGERQRGFNVCIGVTAADAVAAHLPLPPCVSLTQNAEKRRALPQHCDRDHTQCPCGLDGLVARRGPVKDPSPNREKVEFDPEGIDQTSTNAAPSSDLSLTGSVDEPRQMKNGRTCGGCAGTRICNDRNGTGDYECGVCKESDYA